LPKILSSKYLVRLLLFSLLVGTIPVVILGSLSFMRTKHSLQEKVNDSHMKLLQQAQFNVEQHLQLFENLMTQYMSSPIVNDALRMSLSAKQFSMINELAAGINKLQPFELGVKSIYLANLQFGWVLSNEGFTTLADSNMRETIQEYAKSQKPSFWTAIPPVRVSPEDSAAGQPDESVPGVRLVKKLPINWSSTSGLIIGELPTSKLEKMVFNDAEDRETVILDSEFHILTQPAGQVLKSAGALQQAVESVRSSADPVQGYVTFKAQNETIGVMYNKSQYNGWYYLSISSLSDITKDSRSIGWYTVYVSAGVFLIILLLAWIGSKRMYLPIRSVFSLAVGDRALNVREDRDELQVIGDHISMLRTSETQLNNQLRKHMKQLEGFFIRRLLQGEIRPSETRERWVQFSYDSAPGLFGVMTVQIDTVEKTRYNEHDKDLLLFAIGNMANDLIPSEQRLDPVVMVNNQVTICRSRQDYEEQFEADIYTFAERVQTTGWELLGLKISIGLSRPYRDIDETPQAYKESLESLKYRVRFGEQVILPFQNVLPDTQIAMAYPDWMEKELIDAVKMEDREKAQALLNEFIRNALKDNPRYFDFQMVLIRLMIDLLREWQEATGLTVNPLPASGKPMHEQLLDLKTTEEIEAWFYQQILEPMIAALHTKWEHQNKKISERVLELIHEEFESELTLEICASRLNYHPNYIKNVFRKETGTNFSEYLSQYRLTVAKQWLVETDMKISEIAERLRYQNSQNFIRYFRKIADMTPGQYREKHR
jgi:two-component system response regulator YesN